MSPGKEPKVLRFDSDLEELEDSDYRVMADELEASGVVEIEIPYRWTAAAPSLEREERTLLNHLQQLEINSRTVVRGNMPTGGVAEGESIHYWIGVPE